MGIQDAFGAANQTITSPVKSIVELIIILFEI